MTVADRARVGIWAFTECGWAATEDFGPGSELSVNLQAYDRFPALEDLLQWRILLHHMDLFANFS